MKGISKEYGGNRVLKNVSLSVRPGEIHALLGENGAGKSTLMNILFGMNVIHTTGGFSGSVEVDGKPVTIDAPSKAMECGIGMVHQEFMLIPGFTVTENIKVGREITKPNFISWLSRSLETLDTRQMARDARKALNTVGLSIEEYTRVAGLPIGHMQFVEIAREIDKTGMKLLVFDEPTAVLTESEADQLLDAMRVIAKSGIAIIFITHRLTEVMAVANQVTVLRDGEMVDSIPTSETDVESLAKMMIGRKVERLEGAGEGGRTHPDSEIALSLSDFHVDMPGEAVNGITLQIKRGEILGIGGLAGQGKVGVSNGIMGLYPVEGKMQIGGKPVDPNKLGASLHRGVAAVSEDRRGVGLLLDQSIEYNIMFSAMQVKGEFLSKIGLSDQSKIRQHALDMIRDLDIRCTGPTQKVGSLSGGNQQKVCLARALTLHPEILIVAEPTRGIDIGAKTLVLEKLVKLNREQGMTVVIVSSELVELRSVCDRITIVSGGKIADILPPDASDVDFGLAMSGESRKKKVSA